MIQHGGHKLKKEIHVTECGKQKKISEEWKMSTLVLIHKKGVNKNQTPTDDD